MQIWFLLKHETVKMSSLYQFSSLNVKKSICDSYLQFAQRAVTSSFLKVPSLMHIWMLDVRVIISMFNARKYIENAISFVFFKINFG